MTSLKPQPPKIGFVSLGCPKALVDSEQILTQLRAEGYETSSTYEDADLVVVNTCGFIDSAVEESLDAIGEALAENGKVIVTGCLGAKEGGDVIRKAHPQVLAVTGPQALPEVMSAVHRHLPQPHDPFTSLIPPQGIRLTPRHYAYVKISEGCNHRCTFCIIPSMRGDLVSRPVNQVMQEAENLVNAGVKELLIISQDTSAYGVDIKYRTGFWQGRPVKTRMTELVRALGRIWRVGEVALRVSLSARRRGNSADGRGENSSLSRCAVSACKSTHPESHEAASQFRKQSGAYQAMARDLPRHHACAALLLSGSLAKPKQNLNSFLNLLRKHNWIGSAALPIRQWRGLRRMPYPIMFLKRSKRNAAPDLCRCRKKSVLRALPEKSASA